LKFYPFFISFPESGVPPQFETPDFFTNIFCFHLERVGKKKRKSASNIRGSAIGGLKKINGLP
jgi:hypothetical protein